MCSLDYIEKLIYDFYNSSDGHSAANKQLTYYQVSKESWDFSWMLLQPEKAIEVQYFGASCLHMKISKYWNELGDDDEKILKLRSKLLETMCKYMTDGKLKIVQTKLCVALASYIVHSITKHWPTAICDLIDNFKPHNLPSIPPNKIVNTLISILNVIPEEFNTNFLSMADRNLTRNSLVSSVNPVLSVIQSILEQQQHSDLYDVKQLAIKCFSNWSQNLGTLIIEGDLYERNLMLILSAMSDEELISYCSETLISIYSQHEIHKYPNTVLKFIVQIVKLEDLLNDAIKKQQSTIYSALYNLFIHIGETHSRLILDAILTKEEYRDSILKLITFVLQCSATDGYYPVDETCSEQAFNFWYTLQDDIIASEQDKVASYLALFNPLYQTLMDTLIKKVKYPPDQIYEQDWTNEDKESFRCYRQDIGDTFMYCYNMLRNSMLSILMNHFNIAVLQLSNNLSQLNNMHHLNQLSTADKPWQHLEAVIFAFTSISENIDATESIHINNLFESLAQIPLAQIAAPRLTASIMEMFGAYYEWIYNHPEFLPKVLSLLVLGLKSDHIAVVSATMALKDITRECQTLILPYANQLLIACEECLRPNSNLKPKEKSRLMCTIGQVLSITPIEVTMNYLNIILPPLLAGLTVEPAQQDNNLASLSSFSQKNNILHHISMLTMLFTTLDPELKQSDPEDGGNELVCRYKSKQLNGSNGNKFQTPHPTLPIFQEVLPRLIQIATKYINEESIIEAFSDCVKKALFNLLDHAKPLIMDILRVLHDAYSQSYQPSLLDVLKLIMILYWEDTDLKPILNHFYKQVCSQTVNYCCQDAKQKSSLIEYFFTNAHLIMKKIPAIYRENSNQDNQDLQSMFNLASNALVLAEKPTVRSASIFLNEFLQRSVNPDNHNLVIIVNGEGQHLVNRIFVVIGGCHDSSKFNVEFMADLLLSLNQHHFDNYCRWLTIVFTEQDNFPTDKISKQQKEQYTKLLIRERKSKRKLREILSGLTLALRGFNNTEFCSEFFPQF